MAKVFSSIKNIFNATMRGELMFRLKIDKYFIHILYFLFVIWISIFINFKMEQTMLQVEKNRKVLEDLKIYHAQKVCELASYDRQSTVEEMLKASGSNIRMPEKPANKIKK